MLSIEQLQSLSLFDDCKIRHLAPLQGGLSHQLVVVHYTNPENECKRLVLRYLTSVSSGQLEYQVMQHTYGLGIGPAVDSFIDISNMVGMSAAIIAMEFVEGDLASSTPWTPQSIEQLAAHLWILHRSIPLDFKLPISVNKLLLLDEYWQEINKPSMQFKHRFESAKALLQSLDFKSNFVIHGDLNLSNIMLRGDDIIWVDWEYASIGDCYFDYAALIIGSKQMIEPALIRALEKADTPLKINITRLNLFKLYYCVASWLWAVMRNADKERIRYQQNVDQMIALIGGVEISL